MNMREWPRIVTGWLGNGGGVVSAVRYYGSLLLVVLAAFWPFRDLPGYYFTKTETSAALLSARLQSAADLVRVITHPVLDRFHQKAIYYRPTYSLSFSLDYLLWGLEPFGYQLTDLILHVLVAGLLFRVVYLVNDRDVLAAAAAGILYSLHPVLIEVVPAVNHRQETLMAAFLLGAFLAFLRYRRGGNLRWQAAALVLFLLSIGAKESGVVFVPLIMVYVLVFEGGTTRLARRLRRLSRDTGPFVAAAGCYVFWWIHVTRARAFVKGGSFSKPVLNSTVFGTFERVVFDSLPRVLSTFVYGLIRPFTGLYRLMGSVGDLAHWYWIQPGWLPWALSAGLVIVIVGGSLLLVRAGRTGHPEFLFRLGAALAFVLLVGLPFYAPLMDWAVREAYDGEGFVLIQSLMDSRSLYSGAHYVRKARRYLTSFLGVLLAVTGGFWLGQRWIGRLNRTADNIVRPPSPLRPLFFYLLWFTLPLLFFVAVNISHVKHGYHGLLPLGAFLGTAFVGSVRYGFNSIRGRSAGHSLMSFVLVLVVGLHLGALVGVSPLVKDYSTWRHAQEVFRRYYGTLFHQLSRIPTDSRVELKGVPRWSGLEEPYPHFNFLSTSLHPKPLVRVRFPDRKIKVTDWSLSAVNDPEPGPIWLERRQRGSHSFVFVTRYGLPSTP